MTAPEPGTLADKLDALAAELALIHTDTQAALGQLNGVTTSVGSIERRLDHHAELLADHGRRFDAIDQHLEAQAGVLADHGHLLAEIIRRLPAETD